MVDQLSLNQAIVLAGLLAGSEWMRFIFLAYGVVVILAGGHV